MGTTNLDSLELSGDLTPVSTQAVLQKYTETVGYAAFTDGGSTSGTFDLSVSIPVGAVFLRAVLTALTGFAGDTSAVIIVGDGTDNDRYMTGTPDVFTTIAAGLDLGVPSGVAYHAAAKTPTITITSNADWGSVNAGELTIELYYYT